MLLPLLLLHTVSPFFAAAAAAAAALAAVPADLATPPPPYILSPSCAHIAEEEMKMNVFQRLSFWLITNANLKPTK